MGDAALNAKSRVYYTYELRAVPDAVGHPFPTSDLDQMLLEIERIA